MSTKRWTLAEIRQANIDCGHFYFSHDTMKACGDTMKCFKAVNRNGRVFVERVRNGRETPKGFSKVGQVFEFNPTTGHIGTAMGAADRTAAGF